MEKKLVGSWTHEDQPPARGEQQYTFKEDHTLTFKVAADTGANLEYTILGTWRVTPKILCIKSVSCTGPGCASREGDGAPGLGADMCVPFSFIQDTLMIATGNGIQYVSGPAWNRPTASVASTASSAAPPSGPAVGEALVGRWRHNEASESNFTNELTFSSGSDYTMIRLEDEDRDKREDFTETGKWELDNGLVCFQVTAGCTGHGCAPAPGATVDPPVCKQFDLSGNTLRLQSGGSMLTYRRQ